jgi:hypothetical protein
VTSRVGVEIDEASGLRWRDGCLGPKVTRGYFDLSQVEADHENWQKANRGWGARAAKGSGVRGGPEGTRTSFFYNNSFAPFGRTWGAPFAPTGDCPIAAPPVVCDPFAPPDPLNPAATPCPPPAEGFVVVPNLRCMTLDEAAAALNVAGLAVGAVRPGDVENNDVVEESNPGAGTFLQPGNSVDLRFRERDKVGCG